MGGKTVTDMPKTTKASRLDFIHAYSTGINMSVFNCGMTECSHVREQWNINDHNTQWSLTNHTEVLTPSLCPVLCWMQQSSSLRFQNPPPPHDIPLHDNTPPYQVWFKKYG